MDIEKTIEKLSDIREYLDDLYEGESEAFEIAISTLKKEVPQKPHDVFKSHTGEKVGVCVCEYDCVLEHQNYCPECGQKLDWV